MIPVAASWSYTLCCFGIGEVLQDLCVMVVSFSSLSRSLDVSISTCTKITFKSLSFSTPKLTLLPEITRHKNTFLLVVSVATLSVSQPRNSVCKVSTCTSSKINL